MFLLIVQNYHNVCTAAHIGEWVGMIIYPNSWDEVNERTATLLTDAAKYNKSPWLECRIVAKCKTLCQSCPGL